MKLFTVAATALLASTVSARSSWLSSGPSVSPNTDGSLSVPGENPLQHCQDPKDDILTLESVDLSPNPPKAGTKLAIKAKGKLSEDVEDGAKVHLQVKYGLITIIKQTADLCDQVKNVDLECPLHKDKDTALEKEVDLPKEIPPGKYTVTADVESKDGDKITCLQATVEFKRGGAMVVNGQEAVDGKWKQGL